MIGDGTCDTSCNVEACYNDSEDCECAPGCDRSQSSFDSCSDECMNLICDAFEEVQDCDQIDKKKQNYYIQMLSEDFYAKFIKDDCMKSDPNCKGEILDNLENKCPDPRTCYTEKCAYLMPYCNTGTECADDCEVCDRIGECLECKSPKVQYFTDCLDSCPDNFEPVSISFLNHKVCMGKIYIEIKKVSSLENPTMIYVMVPEYESENNDLKKDYSNLSKAFLEIEDMFNTIVLYEGVHDLVFYEEDQGDQQSQSTTDPADPLKRVTDQNKETSFVTITIRAATCKEYGLDDGCNKQRPIIKPTDLVKIYANAYSFYIIGVDFDGSLLVCSNINVTDCSCDLYCCTYCAKIITQSSATSSSNYNDRYESLPISGYESNECDPFKDFIFLESITGSKFYLTDVKFSNFGMGKKPLIKVSSSSLYMSNVEFENIIPGRNDMEAVIYMERLDSNSQNFEYKTGKVSMLNNGYELMSDTTLGGFLIAKKIDKVTIDSVTFEYNIAYQGLDVSYTEGYGALIYLENPKSSVNLSNLSFNNNFLNSGVIYINVNSLEFTESDYTSGVFSATNINFSNIIISQTSCQNHCIYYINSSFLQNIKLSDINITNSVSLFNSMIGFKYSKALSSIDKVGGTKQIIKNSRDSKYIQARDFRVENLTADNVFFSVSFFEFESLANLNFTAMSITNSGDFDQDIDSNIVNDFTFNKFIDKDLYIQKGYPEIIDIQCDNIFSIKTSYAIYWSVSTFSRNNCKKVNGNSNFSILSSSGNVLISNVEFSDIVSSSSYSNAIYIFSHDNSVIMIYDCLFKNINNSSGAGVALISKVYSVEFFRNKLTNIIGKSYGAIHIEAASLNVKNCEFENVESKSNNGGGIAYVGNDLLTASVLKIKDSKFNICMTTSGYGCIVIDGASSSYLLSLEMSNIQISNSKGETAAIYIKDTVYFSTAAISDITVSDSTSQSSGPLYTKHSKGLLKISNSKFMRNKGLNCGIFAEFNKEGTLLSLESISITDGTCSVSSIYLYSKVANTITNLKKITVSINSGKALEINKVTCNDSSSVYEKNYIGLYLANQAKGVFESVQIIQNTNISTAGGVLLQSESTFSCTHCTISKNQGEYGGGIRSEQNSSFTISYSVFNANISVISGSAIFIVLSNVISTVEYSEITNNSSVKDNVISVITGKLNINHSTINNNLSTSGNPSILSYASYITITDSTFSDQEFDSIGFLYLNSESTGVIQRSKFLRINTDGAPGALSIFASTCTVSDSVFQDIESRGNGGAILIQSKSDVSIQNSSFENVNSYNFGGVIFSQDSSLTLDSIQATGFKNSGVFGMSLYKLSIKNSLFTRGYTYQQGGAVYCSECIGVEISDSIFESNTADLEGGAIYLLGNEEEEELNKATISNCRFYNNTSSKGAGIHLTMLSVDIENCEFEENHANSDGGGVSLECSDPTVCGYNINDSNFTSNQADNQGGAISWKDKKPTLVNLRFETNNSTYGNDIAYYPIMIKYYIDDETVPYQRRLQTSELSPIAYKITDAVPGQKLTIELNFAIVDENGNINYSDSETSAEISEVDVTTTVLSGITKVIAQAGVYTFDDLAIQYEPGGTTYLKVSSEAIDTKKQASSGDLTEYYDIVYIEVSFRMCVMGETDLGRECKVCESGTYSLDPSNACADCPSEATCAGDYTMYPKSGYWRTNKFTDTFYECPNPDACLGSNNSTSFTGECDKGYLGNLCQACDNGYSRTSENQCGSCPEATSNAVRLVGVISLMVIICCVMVKTTFKSAYEPSSLHSIYIKIFTNYLQLVMITTQFKLAWPELVLQLFSIQKQSGAVTDQLFSVDCYVTDGSSDAYQNVYFQKLIVLALVPLILFLISFVFWGILAQKHQNRTYLKKEMIATMVILFFLVHPDITRASFAIFSCMNIEGKGYYLLDNLDIECWNGKHYLYSISLALPCIIVWVLGTPALVLYYMYKHKLQLLEIDNKLRFGFLYNGYRNKTFYWEFVILYRKILIISISVFLSTVSIGIQALSALLLLILSLYMQMKTRPFTHKTLNIMEARGILAANVTIYCGLFYLTDDLDETTKYFFFFAIVSVNIYFISYWSYYLCQEGWKIVKKKVGFFRRRFDHEDGYSDFLNEDPLAKKVCFDGDQRKCTLVESITDSTKPKASIPDKLLDLYKQHMPAPQKLEDLPDFAINKCREVDTYSSCSLDITDRSDIYGHQTAIELNIRPPEYEFEDNEEIADELFI